MCVVSGLDLLKDSTHSRVAADGRPAGLSVCGDGAAPSPDAILTFIQEGEHLLALPLAWHSLWVLRRTLDSHAACAH